MFSVYTVCFFGHRQLDDFSLVEHKVETLIVRLLNEHEYVEFLVGREGEFDQLVTSASDSYDNYYDSVEVCEQSANTHPKAAIQIRNRAMIDRSDLCVFYVTHKSGGAYLTLRYADKANANILNLCG